MDGRTSNTLELEELGGFYPRRYNFTRGPYFYPRVVKNHGRALASRRYNFNRCSQVLKNTGVLHTCVGKNIASV